MSIVINCDGACRGNPGVGSWATVITNLYGKELILHGAVSKTTNNEMELRAVVEALSHIPLKTLISTPVHLYSDSKYIVDGLNIWLAGWAKNNWKNSAGKAVKNLDLWKRAHVLTMFASLLTVSWVKGHAGHEGNEQVDSLANYALDEFLRLRDIFGGSNYAMSTTN